MLRGGGGERWGVLFKNESTGQKKEPTVPRWRGEGGRGGTLVFGVRDAVKRGGRICKGKKGEISPLEKEKVPLCFQKRKIRNSPGQERKKRGNQKHSIAPVRKKKRKTGRKEDPERDYLPQNGRGKGILDTCMKREEKEKKNAFLSWGKKSIQKTRSGEGGVPR